MSEIEDAIIVDKIDEMEAEHFEKGSTDLLDFGDTPVHEQEETPVSSTTDQLMDLMKPDTTDAEVAENKEDLPATIGQENVQDIVEPETVTSTAADVDHENQEEQKPKSSEVTKKSGTEPYLSLEYIKMLFFLSGNPLLPSSFAQK